MYFIYNDSIYRIAFEHNWDYPACQPRRTFCTIYMLTGSARWDAILHGTATPNLKAGDRFVKRIGREVALTNLLKSHVIASDFRAAAWKAYEDRRVGFTVGPFPTIKTYSEATAEGAK